MPTTSGCICWNTSTTASSVSAVSGNVSRFQVIAVTSRWQRSATLHAYAARAAHDVGPTHGTASSALRSAIGRASTMLNAALRLRPAPPDSVDASSSSADTAGSFTSASTPSATGPSGSRQLPPSPLPRNDPCSASAASSSTSGSESLGTQAVAAKSVRSRSRIAPPRRASGENDPDFRNAWKPLGFLAVELVLEQLPAARQSAAHGVRRDAEGSCDLVTG